MERIKEVTTTVIDGAAAFTELAAEWDELAGQGITNTPFQSLAYQKAWWNHLGPGSLHTITLRDVDERLIAIAPFYLLDGILYFNGCTQETDYLDLIVTAAEVEDAWEAVFACLCSDDFPAWNGLDLCNIPAASPTRDLLPRLAQERGFSFAESVHEVCPVIPLPDSFEGYLSQLDKKQRHEVRRKIRRANGADAQFIQVGPEDNIETAVNEFLELLQKSTPEKAEWLNEGRRAVFHEVAAAAQQSGLLELLFMAVDGQKAAALFNFNYNDRTWVYNSGLDPTAFGHLSLGVVLTTKAIELAIENGNQTFDFLRGNETYKYRFGAEDTTIYRWQISKEE